GQNLRQSFSDGFARERAWILGFWRDLPDRFKRLWLGFVGWLKGLSLTTRWVLGVSLTLLVCVIAFLAQPNWNWARPTVSSIVSAQLNRPVAIEGPLRV